MSDVMDRTEAVELLQQLGLKEYEAKSFVALARREQGTAKDISETSEVPRTRVYDAVRVLEEQGLVETQHSKPQVFRAVSIEEAVDILKARYVERTESLKRALESLEPTDQGESEAVVHEVWSLTGDQSIRSRTEQLIEGAETEVVLVIGHEGIFTDGLAETLRAAHGAGVDVLVGTVDDALCAEIQTALPEIEVFVSELGWLRHSPVPTDTTEISRLLLVDREAILVSSFTTTDDDSREHEHGVFGRGFDNGVVAIGRRLIATGLPHRDDPADSEADTQPGQD